MKQVRIFSIAAVLWTATTLQAASDLVRIDTGLVKGVTAGGVISFKGIPFAAPPVGDLRWRPPQPAKPWKGIRQASKFGSDCMQKPFPGDAAPLGTPPAEDCLYINVWIPETAAVRKLPVMVWIYGGGFVNGGSSPAVYDGSQFAKRGVVFVSFNYRLGRFGFFAHPALTKENPNGPLGNYGYMDQIAALKWVRRNIAAFGGNPKSVMLFGESAGGGSVLTLMSSPMSQGLFQRAAIESGGGRSMLMGPRYLDRTGPGGTPSAETVGVAFAKSAGIQGEGPEALAALRKLPAEAVVAGLNMATMGTPTYAGPMIDGKVVKESPADAYAAGQGAKIPVMIGANSADIGFSRGRTKQELFAPFGSEEAKAKAAYDPSGSASVMQVGWEIAADEFMVEPARFVARTIAATGQKAYEYRFSYVAESMRKKWPGAPHASEIPYVFDTVAARYGKDLTKADKAMAKQMNAYWANFAKNADPNGRGLSQWPAYSSSQDVLMDFSMTGPQAEADPWKNRLDLVEGLADEKK